MNQFVKSEGLISEQEYNLLMGAKPFTPDLKIIESAQMERAFELIRMENIEFRYLNGSCEDRAHFISILLRNNGIDCGKVWNFAPAKYTFLSNELFQVEDPFSIAKDLTWGYHVAPYILSENEHGEIIKMVIDQSFDEFGFITEQDWVDKMNCPQAIQLHTDIDSYLFNTVYGHISEPIFSYETHYGTPLDIPSIITGNFWQLYIGDDYVQKGLAINDLAIEIFNLKNYLPDVEKHFLSGLLNNIDEVIKLAVTPKPEIISDSTFDHIIQFFFERYYHWGNRIASLY